MHGAEARRSALAVAPSGPERDEEAHRREGDRHGTVLRPEDGRLRRCAHGREGPRARAVGGGDEGSEGLHDADRRKPGAARGGGSVTALISFDGATLGYGKHVVLRDLSFE